MRIVLVSIALITALSACTFVKMGPGAEQVQVVDADGKPVR